MVKLDGMDRTAFGTHVGESMFAYAPSVSQWQPSYMRFPHRAVLEQKLGTSIPGRSLVDADACRSAGAPAFTFGEVSVFASAEPPLRVAAHEAAHQLQHAGIADDGGLGAERHAAVVAHVVSNEANAISTAGARGAVGDHSLHRYTEVPIELQKPGHWDAKKPVRVSEDGMMAVRQDEPAGGQEAWADPGLISTASGTLAAAGSVLQLHNGAGTITGTSPTGKSRTLSKIEPENTATKTKGASMELWADCGRSSRDVMGAGKGTGGGDMVAEFTIGGKPVLTAKGTDPEAMKNEAMQKLLGGSVADAWKKYFSMTKAQRAEVDKKAGINKFAAPGVGGGFTMSSGGANYPGATTWNFHWAGVVMVSGSDRMTLENYATGVPDEKNSSWDFQMYGSAARAGQTFYEQHKATHEHGMEPTVLPVKPAGP